MKKSNNGGSQGVSGKSVKIGKMYADHGSQLVTASHNIELDLMDNRGHSPRKLPLSSFTVKEIVLLKPGLSLFNSLFDKIITFFKK